MPPVQVEWAHKVAIHSGDELVVHPPKIFRHGRIIATTAPTAATGPSSTAQPSWRPVPYLTGSVNATTTTTPTRPSGQRSRPLALYHHPPHPLEPHAPTQSLHLHFSAVRQFSDQPTNQTLQLPCSLGVGCGRIYLACFCRACR